MMLTSTLERIGIVDAAVVAVLGYVVVFFGLILLMCVVLAMGQFFVSRDEKPAAGKKKVAAADSVPAPVHEPAAPVAAPAAPGTAGQLKLHDVPPKTAAMLMAIVAYRMGKPLNELRFISIKEVK